MADRWWVNADADGNWNNANNWSLTEGGAGGAGVPTSSDNALFSATSSATNCTLSADGVCANLYTAAADTGGTDDYSGTIDISTYNLTNSGATKIASGATLKIGVSAGTGLTTDGLSFNSGSVGNFQATSKIYNSGDLTIHNSPIWSYEYRGTYTQTADGNISTPHSANRFKNFTINAGVTLTATSVCKITGVSSGTTTINGTLAIGSNQVSIGCSASSGSIVCGASADITGSGTLVFYSFDGTFTNNKTGAFSLSGSVENILSSSVIALAIPAWDFSNANVTIQGGSIDGRTRVLSSGTLKCKNFSVIPNDSHSMTIDLASHNPSFEISGDVLIDESNATVTWNKGTGTITLTGGDADIDFANKTVEDIIVNASGATKQLTDSVTTESLTVTAGTFDIQTYNCTVSGVTNITGTLKIGVSADTGLSTHGWIVNSGATVDMQTESVINLYPGTVDIYSSATWTLAPAGSYIIHSGTIDWDGLEYTQRPYKFTQNDGSVINLSKNAYFGNQAMHSNILNGVINVGTYVLTIGAENVFTIGANCDLTGTGDVRFGIDAGANITWNCTTSFSHTGNMQFADRTSPGNVMPAANFSNSNIVIRHYSGSLPRMIIISDVQCDGLYCKSFLLEATDPSVAEELIIDNSANCNINISGDLDWTDAVATYDVTYIAGTGTMTFTGTSGTQTINSNGVALGNIVIDAAGAIKQLTAGVTMGNLTLTAGSFDFNGQTVNISGDYTHALGATLVQDNLTGAVITVTGNMTWTADASNVIAAESPGAWTLTVNGATATTSWTKFANCDASGGTTIQATSSYDAGGNTNINFIDPEIGQHFLNGDVAEIIVFDHVLTDSDRQKIEGYLAHKWGLTANLPADHPYKVVAP